jgi:hypothetical protein
MGEQTANMPLRHAAQLSDLRPYHAHGRLFLLGVIVDNTLCWVTAFPDD